jgi:hypothetical protein
VLNRVTNCTWTSHGFWLWKKWTFRTGRLEARPIPDAAYQALMAAQPEEPQIVLETEDRTYWMFQEDYYVEREDLDPDEVKALLLDRELRKRRRIDSAKARVAMGGAELTRARDPIADDVKLFVWQRDGGRCIQCGTQENLEFDHIIPLAMGGANTARNLQLLCADCNRAKGAALS